MEKKPYHHLPNGTFRNPEGSPKRDTNFRWSFKIFNKEKKKLDMTISEDHVLEKEQVLRNLEKYKDNDYIGWIGHATFIIKLGDTTIITDPVFSKNAGPLIFGPKRFTEPALKLSEIPKIDLFLLTHNHYDHQDMMTIRRFPFKDSKVLVPLKLSKYFKTNGYRDINEMDWYDEININKNLKVTFLPAVHWSKRSLTDTNKTLWGSFLIEYNKKKILFACDTGYGNIYKDLFVSVKLLLDQWTAGRNVIFIFSLMMISSYQSISLTSLYPFFSKYLPNLKGAITLVFLNGNLLIVVIS